MTLGADPTGSRRTRVLRRRIVLATLAVAALIVAFWRSWGLDRELLWELASGTLLFLAMLVLLSALGALVVVLLRRAWRR